MSWAFVIDPVGSGRTRLIERVRGRFGPSTIGSRSMLPLMGFGVLVMMRKQMLGIRDRVERAVLAQHADSYVAPVVAVAETNAIDRAPGSRGSSTGVATTEGVPA